MEPIKTTFHDKFRVSSARADWHDYNGGAYFVTICTQNREHFFGEIENGEMLLSEIGKYANQNISEIPKHNPYAEIPLWVVMPDHIHMIVIINHDKLPHEKRSIVVETFHETSLQVVKPIVRATQMQSWLSVVVRQFKQSVTRFARTKQPYFAWQTRYYDRIIRNQDEMNKIAIYIENNVAKWGEGCEVDY